MFQYSWLFMTRYPFKRPLIYRIDRSSAAAFKALLFLHCLLAALIYSYSLNSLARPLPQRPPLPSVVETTETPQPAPYWQTREGVYRLAYAIEKRLFTEGEWPDHFEASIKVPERNSFEFSFITLENILDVIYQPDNRLILFFKPSINLFDIISTIFMGGVVVSVYLYNIYYFPALPAPVRTATKPLFWALYVFCAGHFAVQAFDNYFEALPGEQLFEFVLSIPPSRLASYYEDNDIQMLQKAYGELYRGFSRTRLPELLPTLMLYPKPASQCQTETLIFSGDSSVFVCLPYINDLLVMSVTDYKVWQDIHVWLRYPNPRIEFKYRKLNDMKEQESELIRHFEFNQERLRH